MKFLIGIPIFLLAAMAFLLLAVVLFALRLYLKMRKYMRGDYSDEEVERLSKKYYRDNTADHLGGDYFKRSERNFTQESYSNWQQSQQERTTHTDQGVTIIDGRPRQRASKKIFTEDEGEYVEYQEE